MIQKKQKKQTDEMEELIEKLLLERVLLKDLKGSSLSLGILKGDTLKDDNGRQFFDIMLTPCSENCEREITLTPGEGDSAKAIYFIVRDPKKGEKRFYEPSQAFNPPNPPASFSVTFDSMDRGGVLKRDETNEELKNSPWTKGQMVIIYTPEFRGDPARRHYITGAVDNDHRSVVPDNLDGLAEFINPVTGAAFNDLEMFLRTIPMTPGLKTFVNIEPIKLVKYSLKYQQRTQNSGNKRKANLVRGTYEANGQYKERTIGVGVNKITFSRKSISSTVIYFEVKEE